MIDSKREPAPPDRPRLTVRLGITGHRPGRLPEADLPILRERVGEVLDAFRAALGTLHTRSGHDYAATAPSMTVVSSLASGSDSLVASEALARGLALYAPLPFSRHEYRTDFADGGEREQFDQLLAAAHAVLELDGRRTGDGAAYQQASAVMLEQSDVLLAIWDGEQSPLVGGTSHTIRQALALEIPVLWIDAAAPHALRTLAQGSAGEAISDIQLAAAQALARQFPPLADLSDPVRSVYFAERSRTGTGLGVFRYFRRLVELGSDSQPPGPHAAQAEGGTSATIPPSLVAEHDRADALAQHYAARYRDAFTANYLMGAFAVLAALAGFVTPAGTIVELLLISGILFVTHRGRRGQWHERWLGYRLCAEQLRHLALLRPLGRAVPAVRLPAHAAESDPSRLWTSWLARARTREIGMASGTLTSESLRSYRAALESMLRGQVEYHRQASRRSHHLAHRLHLIGTSLFYLTLLVCIAHLALEVWHHSHAAVAVAPRVTGPSAFSMNGALTLLAAVFPAFGAAFAGIASQGELHRVAQRSRAMSQQLDALLPRLDDGLPSSDACAQVAVQGVEIMTAELLDWQTTFRAKPIVLPA